jgi:hypothetical protein
VSHRTDLGKEGVETEVIGSDCRYYWNAKGRKSDNGANYITINVILCIFHRILLG